MQSDFLRNLVGVGGVMSLTLTFLHPALWAPAIACIGLGALAAVSVSAGGRLPEPPSFHVALLWIALTLALALVNGAAHGFYNAAQISFMLFGLVLGYVISVTRTPSWAAWLPFGVFATLFLLLAAAGRDPGELLTRNSRNFVTVIMLALYASAALMEKPERVGRRHLAFALVTLVIAVLATGRGGIVSALALNMGLFANVALRGRMTFLRSLGVVGGTLIGGVAIYVVAVALIDQGMFGRLASRGLQDAPRLAMILAYFNGIEPMELFLGRDYYDDAFLAQWQFNLHNSYLSAWAHLTVLYLLLMLATLMLAVKRMRTFPVVVFALGAFALRALTDTQMIAGKYDYIFLAALFILLRGERPVPSRPAAPRPPSPALAPTASGARGT